MGIWYIFVNWKSLLYIYIYIPAIIFIIQLIIIQLIMFKGYATIVTTGHWSVITNVANRSWQLLPTYIIIHNQIPYAELCTFIFINLFTYKIYYNLIFAAVNFCRLWYHWKLLTSQILSCCGPDMLSLC